MFPCRITPIRVTVLLGPAIMGTGMQAAGIAR
jgi:hypothetical protein